MTIYWEIYGTILENTPDAQTAKLNPEITLDILRLIRNILTIQPESNRQSALLHLKQNGITPDTIEMYPGNQNNPEDAAEYKARQLFFRQADFYVDNDVMSRVRVRQYLEQICEQRGSKPKTRCVSIQELQVYRKEAVKRYKLRHGILKSDPNTTITISTSISDLIQFARALGVSIDQFPKPSSLPFCRYQDEFEILTDAYETIWALIRDNTPDEELP